MQDRYAEDEARTLIERSGSAVDEALMRRVYTSRLLGSDSELVLHGGGNTSVKSTWHDLLGDSRPVLWVKGSGWDLATIEPAGFSPIDLEYVRRMRGLESLSDEAMVEALQTHKLQSTAPNPSIETLLHGFLPHTFVDHSHATAILSLTNLDDGERVVREALGDDVALVPYVKPGFDLAKLAADVYDSQPDCIGLVLLRHGLFTFGATAEESYRRHIELVRRAENAREEANLRVTFAPPPRVEVRDRAPDRAARTMTVLRGCLGQVDPAGPPVLALQDDPAVMAAMASPQLPHWGRSGPLTPDHVIRTKPWPLLVLEVDPEAPSELLIEGLHDAVRAYVDRYDAYFESGAAADPTVACQKLDPSPRVIWYPAVGLITAGADRRAAQITGDLARQTLLTKAAATPLGPYVGLDAQDLFDMEYWSLEQAKLGRRSTRPLARRVVLVTGGAGAVGVGIAHQLLSDGAHVVLTDVDESRLAVALRTLGDPDRLAGERLDVSSTESVRSGLDAATRHFGGMDTYVLNAGIAINGRLAEVSDDQAAPVFDVNVMGTQRMLREAARRLEMMGTGGDIVVVSSKTVAAPGASFGAYSASKAAAHQLARVAAIELAPLGVRVNLVAPDAVFSEQGIPSGLWQAIGASRAAARGLREDELPAFYRRRNLLEAEITGSDVGRAVAFFVSRQTPTTGAVLPVDGGIPAAFSR